VLVQLAPAAALAALKGMQVVEAAALLAEALRGRALHVHLRRGRAGQGQGGETLRKQVARGQ
jgi:hypothetical protein